MESRNYMLHTREIRWFFRVYPPGVSAWFSTLDPKAVRQEDRTDIYWATGCETVGVKIRQGRLEVKTRTFGPADYLPGGGVACRLEGWAKQVFELAPGQLMDTNSPHLIHVRKQRQATILTWPGPRFHLPVPAAPRGCQIEFTRVLIGSDTWYTLGLEWGSAPTSMPPEPFLAALPSPDLLTLENAMGYPEFLFRNYPPVAHQG